MFNMNMRAKWGYIVFIVTVFGEFLMGRAEDECGKLSITNRYLTAGMTVKMQFYPSTKSNAMGILDRRTYRWLFWGSKGTVNLFSKYSDVSADTRISEDNNILSIKNIQKADEGQYSVECWYGSPTILISSNKVDLKLQEPFFTVTMVTEEETTTTDAFRSISSTFLSSSVSVVGVEPSRDTKPDDTGNNTPVVVGAITAAAVFIVAVVVAVMVVNRRRTAKKEFNNNEEGAGIIHDNVVNDYAVADGPVVGEDNNIIDIDPYNSIDQPITKPETTIKHKASYINVKSNKDEYSTVIPKSLRESKESEQRSTTALTETQKDEYSSIIPKSKRVQSDMVTDLDRKKDTYSTVIPNSKRAQSDMVTCTDRKQETYSTVIPKSQRTQSNICTDLGKTNENHATVTPMAHIFDITENDISRSKSDSDNSVEYSSVLSNSKQGENIGSNCEYAEVLPREQRLLDIHGLDRVDTGEMGQAMKSKHHEYDTPSPVIKRRKDCVKELQYIQIDHSDTSSYKSQSTESLAARPVEYVDIDFTKKAFIAPKRYPPPPSSKN